MGILPVAAAVLSAGLNAVSAEEAAKAAAPAAATSRALPASRLLSFHTTFILFLSSL